MEKANSENGTTGNDNFDKNRKGQFRKGTNPKR